MNGQPRPAVFLMSRPAILKGEFYKYIDENGVKVFADDESLILDNKNKTCECRTYQGRTKNIKNPSSYDIRRKTIICEVSGVAESGFF